jgi:multiple sugar transport system permease protein
MPTSTAQTDSMSGRTAGAAGAVPAPTPALAWRRLLRRWRIPLFCYIALLPVLALFLYVRIIPIGFGFLLSFYRWNLIQPRKPFVGLENYRTLLSDENFHLALQLTTIYSVATVLISTALALPLAVFLSRRGKLSAIYQTIYFLPVITPLVPMSIAWKWIYDYNYGVLNYVLASVGLPSVPWLTDPSIALWALVVMGIWKVLGYNLVLFLVGIRNIPHEYLEAASLDGATDWQRFWRITLPLLKPILLFVLVTSTINAYNVFTQVYVMTLGSQSAPGQAVRMLVFDIYTNGFQFFRMGYASAEAVALTLIVLGLTVIQFTLARTDSAREG